MSLLMLVTGQLHNAGQCPISSWSPNRNSMTTRVVFLDRDGTLNVDYGYVYRVDMFQFTERAAEAIQALRAANYRIAVVSNQSGIASGLYDNADVETLTRFIQEQLANLGTSIDVFTFCPHSSADDCDCRKPQTGMATQVEQSLCREVDYGASWTIGDKISDIEFGKTLGTRNALLHSQYWTDDELIWRPEIISDSLYDAVQEILLFEAI